MNLGGRRLVAEAPQTAPLEELAQELELGRRCEIDAAARKEQATEEQAAAREKASRALQRSLHPRMSEPYRISAGDARFLPRLTDEQVGWSPREKEIFISSYGKYDGQHYFVGTDGELEAARQFLMEEHPGWWEGWRQTILRVSDQGNGQSLPWDRVHGSICADEARTLPHVTDHQIGWSPQEKKDYMQVYGNGVRLEAARHFMWNVRHGHRDAAREAILREEKAKAEKSAAVRLQAVVRMWITRYLRFQPRSNLFWYSESGKLYTARGLHFVGPQTASDIADTSCDAEPGAPNSQWSFEGDPDEKDLWKFPNFGCELPDFRKWKCRTCSVASCFQGRPPPSCKNCAREEELAVWRRGERERYLQGKRDRAYERRRQRGLKGGQHAVLPACDTRHHCVICRAGQKSYIATNVEQLRGHMRQKHPEAYVVEAGRMKAHHCWTSFALSNCCAARHGPPSTRFVGRVSNEDGARQYALCVCSGDGQHCDVDRDTWQRDPIAAAWQAQLVDYYRTASEAEHAAAVRLQAVARSWLETPAGDAGWRHLDDDDTETPADGAASAAPADSAASAAATTGPRDDAVEERAPASAPAPVSAPADDDDVDDMETFLDRLDDY
jgi:hypothetical protein